MAYLNERIYNAGIAGGPQKDTWWVPMRAGGSSFARWPCPHRPLQLVNLLEQILDPDQPLSFVRIASVKFARVAK